MHHIPIGSLVEVVYSHWFGEGACEKVHARLWVLQHSRDCDGTPLYILGRDKDYSICRTFGYLIGGFSEDSLNPIKITPELIEGEGALGWDCDD